MFSLEKTVSWLDGFLDLDSFRDDSNNSLQIAREGDGVALAAFGVDASVPFIREAAAAGAGEFAVEAKALGCDIFVTGEANWGERVAAGNVGMDMVLAGHYETETFGVKALAAEMSRALGVKTVFIGRE